MLDDRNTCVVEEVGEIKEPYDGVMKNDETIVKDADQEDSLDKDIVPELLRLQPANEICASTEERAPPMAFDLKEEKRIRRNLDLRILLLISTLYGLAYADRAIIGPATLDGFDEQLGLQGYDFNMLSMVYYITSAVAAIPTTLLIKRFGPVYVLSISCVCYGGLTIGLCFVTNLTEAILVQAFLAIFQASVPSGVAYYLAKFYRRAELPTRIVACTSAAPLTGVINGLLASRDTLVVGPLRNWQVLFFFQGIVTVLVGLSCFAFLPHSIEEVNWLSPTKKELAVFRLSADYGNANGGMGEARGWKALKRGMLARTTVIGSFSLGVFSLSLGSTSLVFALTQRAFGELDWQTQQLLTTPPFFFATFMTFLMAYIAAGDIPWPKYTLMTLVTFAFGITGALLLADFVVYGALRDLLAYVSTYFLFTCTYAGQPIVIAWVAANSASDTERIGALAMTICAAQAISVASPWIFLSNDAPEYRLAVLLNVSMFVVASGVVLTFGLFLRRENARLEKQERLECTSSEDRRAMQDLRPPTFRYLY